MIEVGVVNEGSGVIGESGVNEVIEGIGESRERGVKGASGRMG